MSIIEKLTEGIVNRDMKKEGAALLNKWSATGLLEGLETEHQKSTMARLLENQAKELLREASSMGSGGDVQGFAAVAFPIVRRVFAGLIANDLVSVQPMSLPSGLIFFLDFVYGDTLGAGNNANASRFGNTMGDNTSTDPGDSIYGGGVVGSQVTGGVNLVGASAKETLGGPRQAVGYGYASPTGSNNQSIRASEGAYTTFLLDGAVSEANAKRIKFDPDLLSITDSSFRVLVADLDHAQFTSDAGDPDFDNMATFEMALTDLATDFSTGVTANTNCKQIRRLTSIVSSTESMNAAKGVRIVIAGPVASINANVAAAAGNLDNAVAAALLTYL